MSKVFKLFDWIEEVLSAAALVVMTAIAFVNVVFRYALSASLSFSEEITTYLFVLLSLLGSAIAVKRRAHLGLNIVTDMVSFRVRKILLVIGYGVATVFSGCIFYYGILMVQNQILLGQTTAAMQWPEWIYGSFVPFGAFFITVRFAQALVEEIRKTEDNEEVSK